MTTIRTFFNLADAELSLSALQAADIDAALADVDSFTFGMQLATGGIRLQVPEADAEEALRILDQRAIVAPDAAKDAGRE